MMLMPSCRQVSDLLSERLDRKLRPMERLRLRMHLAMCKSCARVEGQLLLLRKAMSELPKWRRDS
jgi:predicted anti-sigma-YlaC factor YlaD